MIVPLTKKKKNCSQCTYNPLYIYTPNISYEAKLLFERNLLIETRVNSLNKDFSVRWIFFFLFLKWKNAIERIEIIYIYIYIYIRTYGDVNVDRNLGSASSPINNYDIVAAAKRFNQCHRANFRSPLASSLLPLFLHHRLATPQEITIETQAEVAIYQFPGWTPRLNAGDRDSDFPGVDVA